MNNSNKPYYTAPNLTLQDGLNIQKEDLARWKKILSVKAFKALKKVCDESNKRLHPEMSGYMVFRGRDLDKHVVNMAA